jgi:glc operon protein GlcG
MELTKSSRQLTHEGALLMLRAAVRAAEGLRQPQCIVIVDASGVILCSLRMTGAKFLSLKSASAKATTAASIGRPSNMIPENVRSAIGLATDGQVTGLRGGLPIRIDGDLVGGIGVGSGTGDQDHEVAIAALLAVGAEIPAS